MEVELKTKWVQALRSGDYEQGRAALRSEYGERCVLGVLCDVAGVSVDLYGNNRPAYEWLGEQLGGHPTVRSLWIMNDSHKLTFPQLADWIEENL